MSVFDTLPAEIANSPMEIAISLQTCCKSKKVDDTSSEILIVLLNNSCGCSEDGHFSGRIGGVKLPRPLGLQRQRCGNVQVQERNRYRNGAGTERFGIRRPRGHRRPRSHADKYSIRCILEFTQMAVTRHPEGLRSSRLVSGPQNY